MPSDYLQRVEAWRYTLSGRDSTKDGVNVTNEDKARELADMVGSVVVDEYLPLEVLELTADFLKEDCRQIKQAAQDIKEEQQEIQALAAGKEGKHWQAGRKSTR